MNAMPPRDQLTGKAQRDPVRLTIDFDEEPEGPTSATEAGHWNEADESPPPGRMAARPIDPDPSGRPGDAAAGGQHGHAAAGGQRARAGAASALPPQLAAIELVLTVEVGSLRLPLRDLLAVEPGQLLGLDTMAAEPVSVLVNGRPFARGEIVAIGERFGVRLLEIVAPAAGDG